MKFYDSPLFSCLLPGEQSNAQGGIFRMGSKKGE